MQVSDAAVSTKLLVFNVNSVGLPAPTKTQPCGFFGPSPRQVESHCAGFIVGGAGGKQTKG